MKKNKNKIFALAFALVLGVLSLCLCFVPKHERNQNTTSAYYLQGGDYNSYMPYSPDFLYTGFNTSYYSLTSDGVNYGGGWGSFGDASLTSNTTSVLNTSFDIDNTEYLLYDFQNFLGLSAIEDVNGALDLLKNYITFYDALAQQTGCIFLYFNVTGSNADFYVTNPTLSVAYSGVTKTFDSYLRNGTYNTSYKTGSAYIDLNVILQTFNVDLWTFLTDSTIKYSFRNSVSADVKFFTSVLMQFPVYLNNNLISNLESNELAEITFLNGIGSTSIVTYYYGVYQSGSAYYNAYWSDYYSKNQQQLIDNATNEGYNNGYNTGFAQGSEKASELPNTIVTFASLPFSILGGFLDFDLFGFNIYNVFLALITLLLCVWLIKKII